MTAHNRLKDGLLHLNDATRAVHTTANLADLPPAINPQQASWDRRKFIEMHGSEYAKKKMRRAQRKAGTRG